MCKASQRIAASTVLLCLQQILSQFNSTGCTLLGRPGTLSLPGRREPELCRRLFQPIAPRRPGTRRLCLRHTIETGLPGPGPQTQDLPRSCRDRRAERNGPRLVETRLADSVAWATPKAEQMYNPR
jgi:hypothetical protein